MPDQSMIRTSINAGVARLVLANPERRNALSWKFWQDLPHVVDQLEANVDVRVIVLEADGQHFSAGIDRDAFTRIFAVPADDHDDGRRRYAFANTVRWLQSGISKLAAARVPVIAAVQGACIGAALDLVCAADFIFCTDDAGFQIKEIEFGIVADLGVLQRLPNRMARGLVRELAFTGRRFTAAEALKSGFVNSTRPDLEALRTTALDMALGIARHSPLAIVGTKTALNSTETRSVAEGLEQAALWQSAMGLGSDVQIAWQASAAGEPAHFDNLACQ